MSMEHLTSSKQLLEGSLGPGPLYSPGKSKVATYSTLGAFTGNRYLILIKLAEWKADVAGPESQNHR